ncbi:hypothetical protein, partial [Rhodoplanes roseus]
MDKRTTKGIVTVAAALALAGFGVAPASAAPATRSGPAVHGAPDLSGATVDASAQRRAYRGGYRGGYRAYGYRGGSRAIPFALGAAAVTAAGIAAASSYRRDYYYQPAPYGYYGAAPAYGGYGYGGCGYG